jgi:paraquat-inducible protein B
MSKKASPTVIGIFTLAGLILAGAAVVLFGAGKFFKDTREVMLYFEKSANGLQVGSDVRFGGVRIGSVKSINVLIDLEENRKVIPVVVELAAKQLKLISTHQGGGIDFSSREGVAEAVSKGLRAGMKQQSLLTGQLYIEFDIVPGTPGFIYGNPATQEIPVVPTIGTEIDELIAGVADGLRKFNALDIETVFSELRDVLTSAKNQIAALNIKEINDNIIAITGDVRKVSHGDHLNSAVANLDTALREIDLLAKKANAGFDPLLVDIKAVMSRTDESLAKIQQAADEISQLSNPRSPLFLRMQNLLQETERASLAIKELSNDLKRDPKALISGKAAPK